MFRTYVLTNVAVIEGKTVRTELVTTNLLSGWREYADLLLLASLARIFHSHRSRRREEADLAEDCAHPPPHVGGYSVFEFHPGYEISGLAQARSAPAEARRDFDQAVAMWDGEGFKDRAARHSGIYATYKLALYLIAADRLNLSPPHRDQVLTRLLAMQAPDGGWKTDYKEGRPVGLANVETTCLSLLALKTLAR